MALCVRDCFNCIELDDCDDKVASLWVKMRGKTNKANILLGVCYGTPHQDEEVDEVLYKSLAESQNHRMLGVGRDLCGSSSPTHLPK